MIAGETAAGAFPVEAVKVMTKICREAESSLDYYALFKSILKQAPSPMSPLESLASSAVRTAHKVRIARCSSCVYYCCQACHLTSNDSV
jgi:pyruvate kinase